jgi:Flp pilus assembly protein TadD
LRQKQASHSAPGAAEPAPTLSPCSGSWVGEPDPEIEIRRLATLAQRSPSDARAHTCLANALFDAGRLGEAIREYREAIRLDGPLPDAHRNLAYALLDSGHREAAAEAMDRALRLAPGDAAQRVALRSVRRAMAHHP